MRALDGMIEIDGFTFGVEAPEELQPKRFYTDLHPILGLMGCCILYEADLLCFDKGHQQNSYNQWLMFEILNLRHFGGKVIRHIFLFNI